MAETFHRLEYWLAAGAIGRTLQLVTLTEHFGAEFDPLKRFEVRIVAFVKRQYQRTPGKDTTAGILMGAGRE